MDEIQLNSISFADLSGIRHGLFVSEKRTIPPPKFLVIRYVGVYRDGGAGRGDALYIVATAAAARTAWYSRSTVLDFRDLEYYWGDEMQWVTLIGWDRVIRFHEPLAIVVGEKCRKALQSLLRDEYAKFCVDTLEQAYVQCRQQEQVYNQYAKEWRKPI